MKYFIFLKLFFNLVIVFMSLNNDFCLFLGVMSFVIVFFFSFVKFFVML